MIKINFLKLFRKNKILFILCIFILNGCAYFDCYHYSTTHCDLLQNYKSEKIVPPRFNHLSILGSINVQNEIIYFTWTQHEQYYDMKIMDLMNFELMHVIGNDNKIRIIDRQNLLKLIDVIKFKKILPNLRYWLNAIPRSDHEIDYIVVDKLNNIIKMQQNGYFIHYSKFKKFRQKEKIFKVPTKINLTKIGSNFCIAINIKKVKIL